MLRRNRLLTDAVREIGDFCDLILTHNRKIRLRADDSVCDWLGGKPYMIRRSRGFAPLPVMIPKKSHRQVLAIGGELKNTFCIAKGGLLYASPFVGDMADIRTVQALRESIDRMCGLLEAEPELIVCDLHPLYNTVTVAKEIAQERGIPLIQVQHHYAHILSCMAENDVTGKVIGLSLDGTGYGTDGTIWGGELLLCDESGFERKGAVQPFMQTGGDLSAKEGWRIAAALLRDADPDHAAEICGALEICNAQEYKVLGNMARMGINSVKSTSCGRIFDAISAILGIRRAVTFEGEASTALMYEAEQYAQENHDFTCELPAGISCADGFLTMQTTALAAEIAKRYLVDRSPENRRYLAYQFHAALAEMLVQAERFGYALGDPLLERDNRYQYLQSAFSEPFGQSFGYDALAFAAYLRLYFSQPAVMDPYSIGTIDYLSGNLILDESNAAKGLLYKLSQFTAKHGRGIDDNLLGQVINHKGKNEQISELCSSAKNVLGDRSKCSWSKVSDTYKKLLEEGSVINTLLIMAAADNRKDAEINKSSVRKYYHDNGVDYDALSVLIENTAKELGTSYHQYTGSDWAFLLRNMSEPVEIVGQWFDLVENKHVDKADLISDAQELIKSCTQELEILSKTSLTSGDQDNEVMATNRIIQRTAVYLLERLSGKQTQENYKRYFYIDLLRAPYVALDGRYMPLIEKPEEQVAPQDFYDRIIQYIGEDKKPWKSVIEKIFKFSADRNCYDFGSARQIKKYLEETGQASQWGKFDITREITGLNSEDKKKRNQSPNAWQEEFNASIEMAEIDHWIDTFDTHRVEQLVDAQMKLYKNNENFGFFGRGLRNLLEYIQGKAVELKGQYYDELDEQLEGLDEVEKEKPIFEKIRHAIDKLRFEEARAFLDQVKSGNLDIRLYDQQSLGKVFADFIDEYTHLYNDSLRSKNTMLSVCYERAHPNRKNESAVEFLSAWPAENGFVSKDAVRKFVNVLGLPGKEPAFYIKDKNVCLVKFTEVYRTEYDHPIGNFGTRIERAGLSIVIVQGSDDVDEFYKELETVRSNLRKDRKKDSVIPTLLVLVKSSIRLDVRRQLAGKYARNYNIDPFIIMDRVNAFFIAEFNMATRWQHFLHSSLPFQPENPYCIDPNKEIPPEMFFGRSEKLLEIMQTTHILVMNSMHSLKILNMNWNSLVIINSKTMRSFVVYLKPS